MNRGMGKAAWFVMITIVILVVLSVFGMNYWEKVQAQDELRAQITSTGQLAGKISSVELKALESAVKSKISDVQSATSKTQSSLKQPLDCLDMTDIFYAAAKKEGVEIETISSTGKSTQQFEGVTFDCLVIAVKAQGDVDKLMKFIRNLGTGLPTAVLSSVMLDIPEVGSDDIPAASIVMSVNSYEGK